MTASEWIALVAVIVSPAAALAGAYLNSYLAARNRREESAERARDAALEDLGKMDALLVDASPKLVLANELREYRSPEEAVRGLYGRWLKLREPLFLLSLTHPSPDVRDAAFEFQAQVEISLRMTADAAKDPGRHEQADAAYQRASETANRLGKLLSPYE